MCVCEREREKRKELETHALSLRACVSERECVLVNYMSALRYAFHACKISSSSSIAKSYDNAIFDKGEGWLM